MEKKRLIFGIFTKFDLCLYLCGIVTSFILIIVFSSMENSDLLTILGFLPVIICTILVIPLKKNHNVLGAIKNLFKK